MQASCLPTMAREARSSPVSWSHSSAGWLLPAARFGPSLKTGYVVPFDPEIFKLVALQFLDEAGVQFLLHAFASDVILEQATVTVVFETMSGPVVVRARAVVDCTGDGDIAALAGAEYEVGRAEDGLVQPIRNTARQRRVPAKCAVNHLTPRRPSLTPLDMRPTWLKACGKLPRKSPETGSICSGRSPR